MNKYTFRFTVIMAAAILYVILSVGATAQWWSL